MYPQLAYPPLKQEYWGTFGEPPVYDPSWPTMSDGEMTDDSMSSPALSLRDILVDSDEDDNSMDSSDLSDNPHSPHYSVDGFHLGGGFGGDYLDDGAEHNNGRGDEELQYGGMHEQYAGHGPHASMLPAPHNNVGAQDHYAGMNPDRFLPEQEQIEFLGRHAGRPSNPALPPSAFFGPRVFPDAGDILRRKLLLPPGAPVNLWCVGEPANPTTRPATPYPLLCTLAIYGSEKKRLSLQGIYREIAARFKYYRWQDAIGVKSWRNSIRHALSLYALFINVQRPVREPGKGEYWILGDISSDVRFTRLRKRNTKKKVTVAGGAEADDSSPSDSSSDSGTSQKAKKRATKSSARPAASKKRTRPNRAVSVDSDVTSDADERNTYHAATRGQAPPRRTSTRTRSHRDPAPPTGNMSRRISA